MAERGKQRRQPRQRQPRDAPMRRRLPRLDEAEAVGHGADETAAAADADADETRRGTPSEGDAAAAAAATARTPPDDRPPPFPAFCSRRYRAAPLTVPSLPARPGSGKIVLSDTPCPTMRTTLDPRSHSPSILNRLSRSLTIAFDDRFSSL